MTPTRETGARVASFDWSDIECGLDERGHARLPGLLDARECVSLVRSFADDSLFRSFVDMERYRFGKGDYRYFDHPLPPLVRELRKHLYRPLAAIANRWQERLGTELRYPPRLETFLAACHEAGQVRPTPLLLHYDKDGYNCLHQDRYGDVAFPLQVVIALSRLGRDFEGGEFLLTEQRPRMQSRGEAISLSRGEGLVFPNQQRPVRGVRGDYRAMMRHGLSRLHSGERYALGIIFHDAE
jgi:hypothetical protein